MDDRWDTMLRRGLGLMRKGALSEAALLFRRLVDEGCSEPVHLSYCGLLTAIVQGDKEQGLELCVAKECLELCVAEHRPEIGVGKDPGKAGISEQCGQLRIADDLHEDVRLHELRQRLVAKDNVILARLFCAVSFCRRKCAAHTVVLNRNRRGKVADRDAGHEGGDDRDGLVD